MSLAVLTCSMPRVAHLDLDLDYLSFPAVADLTRIAVANVTCKRAMTVAHKEPLRVDCPVRLPVLDDPSSSAQSASMEELRLVFTPTNVQIRCRTRGLKYVEKLRAKV
ncbi:hypothetical protein AMAG_08437 [Allomyces macrogynus ATCC 38327]|uniref:Uncharacterized protein n=1 Tax=Allomyces macrogynus (strain ATCC 38327) TaxID=578462 RepID=A0A0L0SL56_ALLM3|nr:hypothetical protein AMAG_08437 [Allomyces macrogynus ATCC 38327]|eukprot:KNE63296.1 hypothetical protein AMAG_08437 [Allomyces macrogynus ATCC 38327]